MDPEYKLVRVRASGAGFLSRTPTEMNIEAALRTNCLCGWRLVQIFTAGILIRKTWLILKRNKDNN